MSRRALTLLAWFAFLVACLTLTLSTRVATDLQAFLPAAATPQQQLIVNEIRSGAASGLIMVVVGSDQRPARPGDVEQLRADLAGTGRFRLVASHPDPRLLTARDELFRYRYLLSDRLTPEPFTTDELRTHLSSLVERLTRGAPNVNERVAAADPTGEFRYLLSRWFASTEADGASADGWRLGPNRVVLLAVADAAPYNLDAQAGALRTVKERARALEPALPVELAGAPAVAAASRDTIRSEVTRVSALASLGTLMILLIALRSLRGAVLALVPVLTGLLAGTAAVRLGFGEVHGITLAFGVTLLGVTIDYPLHQLWHQRRTGSAPIHRRLLISAVSTAVGFAAMAVAGYPGLQQLALLSATGIVVAAATTVWVLPLLVPKGLGPAANGTVGERVCLPRWLPGAVAATLVLGGIAAAAGPLTLHTNLAAMSPVPPEVAARDRSLRDRLGLAEPRFVVQAHAADRQAVLRETESLAALLRSQSDRVDRFTAVTELIPSARTQRNRAAALPTPATLRVRLRSALDDLPLRAAAFGPFIDDVGASRRLDPLRPEALPRGLVRQRIDQQLRQHGDRWVSTVHLGGVVDASGLQKVLERAGDWRLTDLQAAAGALVTSYQQQALQHFGIGAALIGLIILAGTRNLRRTLAVLAIAGGGVGGALIGLAVLGTAVSVFHVIALLLVVGLGIDYGLFARPGDRAGQGSVTICAASTALAFGILATADIPLLQAIGVTVTCGTLTGWLLAQLFAHSRNAPPSALGS